MMPSLTLAAIKAAQPGPKPQKLFDGQGLHLFVSPAGAKVFRLQFRVEKKQQQVSLGPWPEVSLVEAREKAFEMRRRLRQGEDIRKPKALASKTLLEATTAFIAGRGDWSDGYKQNFWRGIEMHLGPDLGDRDIRSIDREALMRCLDRMDAAGKHVYVRRVRMWVGQVFDFAVEKRWAEVNPAVQINPRKAFGKSKEKHHAAVGQDEVADLLGRLSLETTQSAVACRLLALTWLRTAELRGLEWGDVKGDRILIPEGRMKREADHLVPLSKQALKLLETQKRITGGYRHVFVNDRRVDRPISENAVLYLLHRMGYKGRMTGHGWRTIGSTWANEHHWPSDAIERQLAHVEEDEVRGAYNRAEFMPKRTAMLQAFADWLDFQEREFHARSASTGASPGPAAPA